MTLKDWNEYDRYKRDFLFLARRTRELGKDDNKIIELLSRSYVEPKIESYPLLKGLLNEVEWYLNYSRKEDWIILPLYEGAVWLDEETLGNTPDFIVAGEYPDKEGKGIFFAEIKSSKHTLDYDNKKIRRMQQMISMIFLVSEYEIPLYVFFKEKSKWNFERFWYSNLIRLLHRSSLCLEHHHLPLDSLDSSLDFPLLHSCHFLLFFFFHPHKYLFNTSNRFSSLCLNNIFCFDAS